MRKVRLFVRFSRNDFSLTLPRPRRDTRRYLRFFRTLQLELSDRFTKTVREPNFFLRFLPVFVHQEQTETHSHHSSNTGAQHQRSNTVSPHQVAPAPEKHVSVVDDEKNERQLRTTTSRGSAPSNETVEDEQESISLNANATSASGTRAVTIAGGVNGIGLDISTERDGSNRNRDDSGNAVKGEL